ncbi:MAG: flagellar protein FlgN [Rhodocyclaceae bacterium]
MHQLLLEEVAQLRGFLALLEQEQLALAAGDVERVLPLAEEKNGLFGRLAQLGDARGKALAALGLSPDRQGIEGWLARHPEQAGARREWQELLLLAAQAHALNQTNGKLIAERLAHNQQALSTLMAAANQAALYGPDGQARPVGSGRSLGSV